MKPALALLLVLIAITSPASAACVTNPEGRRYCVTTPKRNDATQICINRCNARGEPTTACVQRCLDRWR